jgi:hypothetical protein
MQKGKTAENFGSLLEYAAIGGLLVHLFVVSLSWKLIREFFYGSPTVLDAAENNAAGNDVLWLFTISLIMYGGLTVLGRHPEIFNYPWTIDESNAPQQYKLARNFIKQIKVELAWLFAMIALQTAGQCLEEFGGLVNFSIFLMTLMISATVIGYLVMASRSAFRINW